MDSDAPDRIVMVTNSSAAGWELAAFEADTGAQRAAAGLQGSSR